ncbi:hypothetical protein AB1K84_18490 [Mesobacillus foraminis]|uniref:hypothetical protein n=1 Tax=Mesobacillus foraminis TaxID=279826 RepID=UPI0039A0F27E
MANLLNIFEGLFKKASDTEERYEKALENKDAELLAVQAELQEKETMLKDMHKMKLLGDISESTYEAEKEKVEKLQKKLQEVKQELELIQVYKTDDVKAVLAEIEANNSDLNADTNKEIQKIKEEVLQAKHEYLSKLAEAGKKYNKAVNTNRRIDELKIKLGVKQTSYISDASSALQVISIGERGHENLTVDNTLVFDALHFGRIPSQLHEAVKKAKGKL